MKTLIVISIGLGALVVVGLLLVALAPKRINTTSTVLIDAPVDAVYAHISTLKGIDAWSPFIDGDQTRKVTITQNDGTPGALLKWTGEKTGVGEQELVSLTPLKKVTYQVRIISPYQSTVNNTIALTPIGNKTKVEWTFDNQLQAPTNVIAMFMGLKKMFIQKGDEGMALLKGKVESVNNLVN